MDGDDGPVPRVEDGGGGVDEEAEGQAQDYHVPGQTDVEEEAELHQEEHFWGGRKG